jgi:hypothetical protein
MVGDRQCVHTVLVDHLYTAQVNNQCAKLRDAAPMDDPLNSTHSSLAPHEGPGDDQTSDPARNIDLDQRHVPSKPRRGRWPIFVLHFSRVAAAFQLCVVQVLLLSDQRRFRSRLRKQTALTWATSVAEVKGALAPSDA